MHVLIPIALASSVLLDIAFIVALTMWLSLFHIKLMDFYPFSKQGMVFFINVFSSLVLFCSCFLFSLWYFSVYFLKITYIKWHCTFYSPSIQFCSAKMRVFKCSVIQFSLFLVNLSSWDNDRVQHVISISNYPTLTRRLIKYKFLQTKKFL